MILRFRIKSIHFHHLKFLHYHIKNTKLFISLWSVFPGHYCIVNPYDGSGGIAGS